MSTKRLKCLNCGAVGKIRKYRVGVDITEPTFENDSLIFRTHKLFTLTNKQCEVCGWEYKRDDILFQLVREETDGSD